MRGQVSMEGVKKPVAFKTDFRRALRPKASSPYTCLTILKISLAYLPIFAEHHVHPLLKLRHSRFSPGEQPMLPPQTQEPRLQFYQVLNRCGSFPLLSAPHSLFNIWTDLKRSKKYPRGINVEVRRMDVANWTLRTSPKLTIEVKYQFHQGFWPEQISGNPNHPSPPICSHRN